MKLNKDIARVLFEAYEESLATHPHTEFDSVREKMRAAAERARSAIRAQSKARSTDQKVEHKWDASRIVMTARRHMVFKLRPMLCVVIGGFAFIAGNIGACPLGAPVLTRLGCDATGTIEAPTQITTASTDDGARASAAPPDHDSCTAGDNSCWGAGRLSISVDGSGFSANGCTSGDTCLGAISRVPLVRATEAKKYPAATADAFVQGDKVLAVSSREAASPAPMVLALPPVTNAPSSTQTSMAISPAPAAPLATASIASLPFFLDEASVSSAPDVWSNGGHARISKHDATRHDALTSAREAIVEVAYTDDTVRRMVVGETQAYDASNRLNSVTQFNDAHLQLADACAVRGATGVEVACPHGACIVKTIPATRDQPSCVLVPGGPAEHSSNAKESPEEGKDRPGAIAKK